MPFGSLIDAARVTEVAKQCGSSLKQKHSKQEDLATRLRCLFQIRIPNEMYLFLSHVSTLIIFARAVD